MLLSFHVSHLWRALLFMPKVCPRTTSASVSYLINLSLAQYHQSIQVELNNQKFAIVSPFWAVCVFYWRNNFFTNCSKYCTTLVAVVNCKQTRRSAKEVDICILPGFAFTNCRRACNVNFLLLYQENYLWLKLFHFRPFDHEIDKRKILEADQ